MRGRSPYNKPSVRIKEAHDLLLKLGGEARWKDLKANLKELGWGPTTLKQTLDQMIKKRLIRINGDACGKSSQGICWAG